MSAPEDKSGAELEARRITVAYGRETIIDGLDLAVTPGALTALVGANGSGKSTLLKALAGALAPTSGEIALNGRSIAGIPSKQLARHIGMLGQASTAPEGLNVLDLVQQGRYPHRPLFGRWSPIDEQACDRALALTEMTALKDRQLTTLSGGQRQRAWIALTLAQQTPILLLDEPTSFLDLAHQIEVMELMRDLVRGQGKTVVAVLHDLNQAARYADWMVVLKAGTIVASGAPAAVMTEGTLAEAFAIDAHVMPDPVTGTPMCLPKLSQVRSRRRALPE